MICLSCRQDFHSECGDPCCCVQATPIPLGIDLPPVESPSDFKDPHSTGRKRAFKLYPLDYDAPCEWRGIKYAGGGNHPIVGCANGKQQSRHHGPDKNTLNNTKGNVHRICHDCHNNWHAVNDPGYQWGDHIVRTLHDSHTVAEPEILGQEILRRSGNKVKNVTRNQGD